LVLTAPGSASEGDASEGDAGEGDASEGEAVVNGSEGILISKKRF
jgi:hypothetical protein